MEYKSHIPLFSQNRVWRTYPGGKVLDQLAGKQAPTDSHFPEDWIGSVTKATNPGREDVDEGISTVLVGDQELPMDQLLELDPGYFLGEAHVSRYGVKPQLLVKLLDSAVRLHFQCHPTAEFAQLRMNEPSGKAEAYYILEVRDEIESPYVYVGFQRPPARQQLKEWIEKQNMEAIEACMDKIPVKSGDTLFIPGGFPHAIGEGILLVEIMEPSDLAIRFEFEKAGYTLPESARFMGRGLDFCLEAFDFSKTPLEGIRENYFLQPKLIKHYAGNSGSQFHLIGSETTPCMQVRKSIITNRIFKQEDQPFIGIVTEGSATLETGSNQYRLNKYDKFFYPAGIDSIQIDPSEPVTILECYPPAS